MARAFGIVNFAGNHIQVEGMQAYRPVGAFSFLGRYRVIDFQISNMSNSGIDHIQVYIRRKPQSLTAHLGTGRHYNINSKRGRLQILYAELGTGLTIYNNDIAAYMENMEYIEKEHYPYVILAPSYMIYTENYSELLQNHIDSGADITLLYHSVDNAKEYFLNCYTLNLNRQKGVLSIDQNHGNAKNRNILHGHIYHEEGAVHRPGTQGKEDFFHVYSDRYCQCFLRGAGYPRCIPQRLLCIHYRFQELL